MEGVVFISAHAIFGLIIGSFLNVLILRRATGRTLWGRSRCLSCSKMLRWHELIPIISWVYARGRCRSCGARISLQYPLTEATTALLFVAVALAGLAPILHVFALGIVGTLVFIAAYDIRHTIIPDVWAYTFAALALAFGFLSLPHVGTNVDTALLFAAGPFVALPLWALWFLSRGIWMGLGDAKLALGIGWLLGIIGGLESLFLAFIIGAVVSVTILLPFPQYRALWRGLMHARSLRVGGARLTMRSEVPFGPFLIVSCLIVWFLQINGLATEYLVFGMLY